MESKLNIGIVSDTHMPRFGKTLPAALVDGFARARVEQILHLGDFTGANVPDLFEELGSFDAVAGNNDPAELWQRFGRKKIVQYDGVRIGMIHGDGSKKTTLERAIDAFSKDTVDVILYGHSHIPYCARHGETLVLNPGSPTDKRRNAQYSYAILNLGGKAAVPSLHYFGEISTGDDLSANPEPLALPNRPNARGAQLKDGNANDGFVFVSGTPLR